MRSQGRSLFPNSDVPVYVLHTLPLNLRLRMIARTGERRVHYLTCVLFVGCISLTNATTDLILFSR